MFLRQVERSHPEEGITRSRLNLVDLAGSEKWNMEQEMGREHIAEMTNINLRCAPPRHVLDCRFTPKAIGIGFLKRGAVGYACVVRGCSLHTLSRCINALAKSGSAVHVPFRESKLTRLLKDR